MIHVSFGTPSSRGSVESVGILTVFRFQAGTIPARVAFFSSLVQATNWSVANLLLLSLRDNRVAVLQYFNQFRTIDRGRHPLEYGIIQLPE